jgi:hypothetical protein
MLTRNNFDVPVFEYYTNGGRYSGCKRSDKKDDFNYKVGIDKGDDGKFITVYIWYGIYCYEASEEVSHESFSADPEGLQKAYDYIDSAYDLWNEKRQLQ